MSETPLLLTFDSSVIFAVIKRETYHDLSAIEQLISLARESIISIQVTEAFRRDVSRSRVSEVIARQLDWLAKSPVLQGSVGGVFRLDVSLLGSNDMLCDKRTETLNDKLIELLGIQGKAANPSRAYSDIDHLLAHALSGADMFVTVDEDTILNRQKGLWGLGLKVLRPAEALRRVSDHHNFEDFPPPQQS